MRRLIWWRKKTKKKRVWNKFWFFFSPSLSLALHQISYCVCVIAKLYRCSVISFDAMLSNMQTYVFLFVWARKNEKANVELITQHPNKMQHPIFKICHLQLITFAAPNGWCCAEGDDTSTILHKYFNKDRPRSRPDVIISFLFHYFFPLIPSEFQDDNFLDVLQMSRLNAMTYNEMPFTLCDGPNKMCMADERRERERKQR